MNEIIRKICVTKINGKSQKGFTFMNPFMNEVILQGTIVGKIENAKKKFCILTLATTTYTSRNESRQNYPRVFFSGDAALEAMKFKKADHVFVSAIAQQYGYRSLETKKDEPTKYLRRQRIRGLNLKASSKKSSSEYFQLSSRNEPPKNEAIIAGKVISIVTPNDKTVLLTIQDTPKYNPLTLVRVTYYTDAKAFKNLIKKNDFIYGVGYIATIEPDKEHKDKVLENFVVTEILKINIGVKDNV